MAVRLRSARCSEAGCCVGPAGPRRRAEPPGSPTSLEDLQARQRVNPVEIRSLVEAELALWRATAELATALPPGSWTLVGAQMVFLIAYEHELPIGRTSGDVDLMMDVRALTGATQEASRTLERSGTSSTVRRRMGGRIDSGAMTPSSMSSPPRASEHDPLYSPSRPGGRSPWRVGRRLSRAAERSGCCWKGVRSSSPVLPFSERS